MAIKFKAWISSSLNAHVAQRRRNEKLVRDNTRKFIEDNLIPIIEECNRAGRFPRNWSSPWPTSASTAPASERVAAAGMSAVEYGLMTTGTGRGDSGVRSFVSVQSALCMYPIHEFGSQEQKQKYLPRMALGEILGCFGLTGPMPARTRPPCALGRARTTTATPVLNGL